MSGNCFFCGTETTKKCPNCDSIHVCNDDHLGHHRDEDTGLCQPFAVRFGGNDVGRFCVATRDIKPFETVIIDRAVGLGIFDDSKPVCLTCYEPIRESGSVPCPFCRMPMCDDPKCLDSERHKPECKILRRHEPEPISVELDTVNPVYALIGPLRLFRWKSEPYIWNQIVGLEGHVEERKSDFREQYYKTFLADVLQAWKLTGVHATLANWDNFKGTFK